MSGEERTDYCWIDGEFVEWDNAKVHIKTHALHYGSGVFEGIRGYATKDKNVYIFRLKDHVDRLFYSAKIYKMEIPYTKEEMSNAIIELVKKNNIKETIYIRPIVFRGYGPLGLNPFNCPVSAAIYIVPFGRYLGPEALEKGVKCCFTSWERISPRALPPEAKACGQYINSILAKMEAIENGYDEALFLDHRGFVSEGSGENIFMIKDQTAITPPVTASILIGITRDSVIKLMGSDLKVPLFEQDVTRAAMYNMDEVFITGTAGEVTPVVEIDKRVIGDGKPGPITRKVQKAFSDVTLGKNPRYEGWVTPVY
ncbi:MAG: branched-chain amino acid transaminase [Candidatus Freyarchaeum deiterrae]